MAKEDFSLDTVLAINDQYSETFAAGQQERNKAFLERNFGYFEDRYKGTIQGKEGRSRSMTVLAYEKCVEDLLLVFLHMDGQAETKFRTGKRPIGSVDEMHAFDASGKGKNYGLWDETLFCRIYGSREGAKKYGLPNYVELIDMVGSDPAIVEHWGKAIVYANDIHRNGKG